MSLLPTYTPDQYHQIALESFSLVHKHSAMKIIYMFSSLAKANLQFDICISGWQQKNCREIQHFNLKNMYLKCDEYGIPRKPLKYHFKKADTPEYPYKHYVQNFCLKYDERTLLHHFPSSSFNRHVSIYI